MDSIKPVWEVCKPRKDVLEGRLLASELALSLSDIVWGRASPPYDDPKTFLDSTHPTTTLKTIVGDILRRLWAEGGDINPVIMLDVGFGGGKTHTLASLYYAAKFGAPQLSDKSVPSNTKVVAISGEEYDSKGVKRNNIQVRTIWGDLFYQIGKYDKYSEFDAPTEFPGKQTLLEAMGDAPLLVLLDEIPTYLDAIKTNPDLLSRTVQFLQRLVLAVASKRNAAIVMAIAEDAYKLQADKAKMAVAAALEEAKKNLGAIYKRQQMEMRPVQDDDVVHVLKKRMFESIPQEASEKIADAYHELYGELAVPDIYKSKDFRDKVVEYYPFHPDLITVFYERVATLEGFHRTRGSLRLITAAIMKIWKDKEQDAILIHPFHIDLADENIANGLTIKIGEPKYRNAVESDVWNSSNSAVAQKIDQQSSSHWGAPLARRACNTVYLYSLSGGRTGDKGIRYENLLALMVTPTRKDHYFRVRDTITQMLLEEFHFIERQGERLLFVKEPSLIKLIQNHARDIPQDRVMEVIRSTTSSLFSGSPDWMVMSKVFVNHATEVQDETSVTVAVLNPMIYSIVVGQSNIPQEIRKIMEFKDDYGNKARAYRNSTFLLVADEGQKQALFISAQKLVAARDVEYEPEKYSVPVERKTDVAKYRSEQEGNLNDAIRATFTNMVYMKRDGIKHNQFNPTGYSKGKGGKEVLSDILAKMNRILDRQFDPDVIMLQAWITGRVEDSAFEIYDKFHRMPDLPIPVSRDIYYATLKKGVEDRLWVLKTGDKIVRQENVKSSITVTEQTKIILYEEAEKLGLLEDVKTPSSTISGGGGKHPPPTVAVTIKEIPFASEQLIVAAQSIPKKMKPDFTKVKRLSISTSSSPHDILKANHVLVQMSSDRDCAVKVEADLERWESPEYNLHFKVTKEDLTTDTGKKILELGRQFLQPGRTRVQLVLEWKEGITGEQAEKLIREYDSEEKMVGDVSVTVSK